MKRLIIAFAAFLLTFSLQAQSQQPSIQDLAKDLSTKRISFSFRYTPKGGNNAWTSGKVLIQGGYYVIEAAGSRIICDGAARYTIDDKAKEVYVERAERLPSWLTNPKALTKAVSDVIYSGNNINGTFTNPDDKQQYNFTISGLQTLPPSENKTAFQFSLKSLDKSWIVTDLR